MIPPPENFIAAFPPSRRAGNVILRPLSIEGAIRLGKEGVDCGRAVPRDKLVRAAFILSGERNSERFFKMADYFKRTDFPLHALSVAVEAVLNDAFSTFIAPARAPGPKVCNLTPHGLGWPLELAEAMMAEYGWTWEEAAKTPVARAWALLAACRQRQGGRFAGLDYAERLYAAAVKSGRVSPPDLEHAFDKERRRR